MAPSAGHVETLPGWPEVPVQRPLTKAHRAGQPGTETGRGQNAGREACLHKRESDIQESRRGQSVAASVYPFYPTPQAKDGVFPVPKRGLVPRAVFWSPES